MFHQLTLRHRLPDPEPSPKPWIPYGLTQLQAATWDALVTHGSLPAASLATGVPVKRLEGRIAQGALRIPGKCKLHKIIAWAKARNLP